MLMDRINNIRDRIGMTKATDAMSKKFSVTVPDKVAEDLAEWADFEGRPKAQLAGWIVELAVKSRFPERYPEFKLPTTQAKAS